MEKTIKKAFAHFKQVYPVFSIEEDKVVLKDGRVAVGYSLSGAPMESWGPSQYEYMHFLLVGALQSLPVGTVVHKTDVYYDKPYQSDVKEKAYFEGKTAGYFMDRLALFHKSYLFVSFPASRKVPTNSLNTLFAGLGKTVLSDPFAAIQTRMEEAEALGDALAASMNMAGSVKVKRLQSEELSVLYRQYFNLDFDGAPANFTREIGNSLAGITVGEKKVHILSLKGQGGAVFHAVKNGYHVTAPMIWAIGGFAGFIVQPDNIYQNLDILGSGVPQQPPPAEEGVAGYIDQAVDWIGSFNLHYWLQSLVVGGVASVARKLIEIFRQSLLGFLYVVGPIALSLSALPGFGGLLRKWFQNYFSVQCWSITLIILDNLVDLYTTISQARTSAMTGGSLPEASEKIDILLITIVITLLYFMVPYLTSLFVGQTGSAIFTSKMISLGTAGATLSGRGGMVAGKAAMGAAGLGVAGVAAGAVLAGKGIGKAVSSMREATDFGSNVSNIHSLAGNTWGGFRPPAGNQNIPVRKA